MNNNQIDKLFFGQRVVFVGRFKKIKKDAAIEYILKNSGVINKKVSWNTNIVIVGEASRENKNLIKLNELIYSAGRSITRISEDDFLCHIEEVSLKSTKQTPTSVFDDLIRPNDTEKKDNYTPRKIRKMYNFYAKLIAANVRNNMEDFHCKYLSDTQMKELNPLIRDAIYTAMVNMTEKPEYINHYHQHVPPYWEDCELTTSKSYTKNRLKK
jgi:predicted DNA-binding protein YlxM (UPF0122 family)